MPAPAEIIIGVHRFADRLGRAPSDVLRLYQLGWLPRAKYRGNVLTWTLSQIHEWERAGCPRSKPRKLYRNTAGNTSLPAKP